MNPLKIGRNEPCSCGSGKKYKRCCGQVSGSTQQLSENHSYIGHVPAASTKKLTISLFPTEEGRLSLVPDHLNIAAEPGKYIATFVLNRPGYLPPEELLFDFGGEMTGDSHLAITKPAFVHPNLPDAVSIRIETGTSDFAIRFEGRPNARGYLAKLQSEPFEANNFEDADSKAYHLIAPVLSCISTELDIPVSVF